MRRATAVLALCALLACNREARQEATAMRGPAEVQVRSAVLPPDAAKFVERLEGCEHFSGEPHYDAERSAFLDGKIDELCPGNDKALEAMRRKYADNPAVMEKLDPFVEAYR